MGNSWTRTQVLEPNCWKAQYHMQTYHATRIILLHLSHAARVDSRQGHFLDFCFSCYLEKFGKGLLDFRPDLWRAFSLEFEALLKAWWTSISSHFGPWMLGISKHFSFYLSLSMLGQSNLGWLGCSYLNIWLFWRMLWTWVWMPMNIFTRKSSFIFIHL